MLKMDIPADVDSDEDYENSLDFTAECVPHYTEMINYARRLAGGNTERAQDVVQEAMFKAFKDWKKYRPIDPDNVPRSTRAWLYRIVQFTYITGYHSERVHKMREEQSPEEILRGSAGHENDHLDMRSMLTSPMGDEVLAALDKLSGDHRRVIELHYVDGMPCEEIAEETGIPKNTVFTRLARARVVLARALQFYAREEYGFGKTSKAKASGKPVRRRRNARNLEQPAAPVQVEETDSDGVDSIVAVDDDGALEYADTSADQPPAW